MVDQNSENSLGIDPRRLLGAAALSIGVWATMRYGLQGATNPEVSDTVASVRAAGIEFLGGALSASAAAAAYGITRRGIIAAGVGFGMLLGASTGLGVVLEHHPEAIPHIPVLNRIFVVGPTTAPQ